LIFPSLQGKPFGYINLALYAKVWLAQHPELSSNGSNPLLIPAICQAMVDDLHAELGLVWSWGGWLEDRGQFWQGSTISEYNVPIHLGVDLNAPAGTPLSADVVLRCLSLPCDHPEKFGWGARMVARAVNQPYFLFFAHLQNIDCQVGDTIHCGDIFAEVGSPESNGGWFAHTHVQVIAMENASEAEVLANLVNVPGYVDLNEVKMVARVHPDPLQFIKLW
jgi:hypothetical protein